MNHSDTTNTMEILRRVVVVSHFHQGFFRLSGRTTKAFDEELKLNYYGV